jgi:hypothetical protein
LFRGVILESLNSSRPDCQLIILVPQSLRNLISGSV